jgi:diguanylate cyclase (GGDEF)-like protein/PAS domain S-box-containing protein
MGPAALAVLLVLRTYGLVADVSTLTWIAVFVAIPGLSIWADLAYRRHPSAPRRAMRIALHCAAVTVVIYLSGWGPVLMGAYAFVALENLAHDGSRTAPVTMACSLAGIAAGMIGIWQDWLPSFLSVERSLALSVMGAFVLAFVIRMAATAWAQKEEAELATRDSEDRFRSLVQHSTDTTLVIGDDRRVAYASPAVYALLGLAPAEVVGRDPADFIHPDDLERIVLQLRALAQSSVVAEGVEARLAHVDGSWRTVEAALTDLRDRPSVGGFVANLRDITERKEAEDLLAHRAVHDPLTGLANRTLILDRADQMLVRGRRGQHPVAALFIDLDNFKEVNDTLGHEAGDKLLRAVAARFSATVRGSDTVGRLGGDEFVVLADALEPATGPEQLAERLRDVLREPFLLDGLKGTLSITASIGIAEGDRITADELLRDADIALYRAKAMGKDRAALFAPEMQSAVIDRLGLKIDLQTALAKHEFVLVYQPLFDLDTRRVYGVEALLRWHHPERGVVSPGEFIPVLEDSGLISEVGRWVLREACRQAAVWHALGHRLTMSVNVSMRQLDTPALVEHVREALDESGLPPSALLLEITETALAHDTEATVQRLGALKALGVNLAIDDFGTGYSSLGYLRQFPVDALKIDRSFIESMTDSPESTVLIHAMVALAHALGLGTVAEGIEDDAQLETLRTQGCQRGQGYLVSRPVEPAAILAMLRDAGTATVSSAASRTRSSG